MNRISHWAISLIAALFASSALAVETFPATNCESYNSPNTAYYNQVVHDGGALYNHGYDQTKWTLIGCPVRWSKKNKSLKLRIHDSDGGMWCRAQALEVNPEVGHLASSAILRYSDGSGAQLLNFGNRPGSSFDLGHVWVECYLPPQSFVRTIILDDPQRTFTGGLTLR